MLGIDVQRGVSSTLERIFKSSGNQFDTLEIVWSGETAGIIFDDKYGRLNAKIIFPSIDENADIPKSRFNDLIGYALHELGHAWFTKNEPWDNARNAHGHFVHKLINGLEDPRIEMKVINSGHAPNARLLFESLINNILDKGYAEPDDYKNIPFMLAIEGRRLNGYGITAESIIPDSPYGADIAWAINLAKVADNTERIVEIAIELNKRLQKTKDKLEKEQQGNAPQPTQGNSPEPSGESNDPADGDGSEAQSGDEQGDEQGDEPNADAKGGDGDDGERDVDPNGFITKQLGGGDRKETPAVGKPIYYEFNWD
jgi:hypothetical protein